MEAKRPQDDENKPPVDSAEVYETMPGDGAINSFEAAQNIGGNHNRDTGNGPRLQDNQLPGDRRSGNASESGVPGAFGSEQEDQSASADGDVTPSPK